MPFQDHSGFVGGKNVNMKHALFSSYMMRCDLNLRKKNKRGADQVLVTLILENILIPLHEKTNAFRLCASE